MQSILEIETTVLPGHRVEITAPTLPEGSRVEVTLRYESPGQAPESGILEFLDALPLGPHSAPSWEELENRLQAERNSW